MTTNAAFTGAHNRCLALLDDLCPATASVARLAVQRIIVRLPDEGERFSEPQTESTTALAEDCRPGEPIK